MMNLLLIQRSIRPLAGAFLAAIAMSAFADNPQYRRGPTCTDNGITATCSGRLSGLGNGDVRIDVSFPNATASTLCHAPGGGNTAPGQNPAAPVSVSGSANFPDPKNGSLSFSVPTNTPTTPTSEQAGCPNTNWSVTIEDVYFGNGFVTIYQQDENGIYQLVLGPTPVTAQ